MSTRHLGAYTANVASDDNKAKGFLKSKLHNIQAPKQTKRHKPSQNKNQPKTTSKCKATSTRAT